MPDLRSEILAEIRKVLAADLEVNDPVELNHELARDLGVDSMGAIILAVALEDRFLVKLSDQDAVAVVTVGDLVDLVGQRVQEARSGDDTRPRTGRKKP